MQITVADTTTMPVITNRKRIARTSSYISESHAQALPTVIDLDDKYGYPRSHMISIPVQTFHDCVGKIIG